MVKRSRNQWFGWTLALALVLGPEALAAPRGQVAFAGDEWVFSQYAFNGGLFGYPGNYPEASRLLSNTLDVFGADTLGTHQILELGGENSVVLGASFDSIASSKGFGVTHSASVDSVLNYDLGNYDMVFLTGMYARTRDECLAIYDYVKAGGKVFIRGGVGAPGEWEAWERFMPTYGIHMGPGLGPVFPAELTVDGGLPSFTSGVSRYVWSNGWGVSAPGVESALAVRTGAWPSDYGMMAFFEDDPSIPTPFRYTPEPASALALGSALLVMLARRRKSRH